MKNKQFDTWFEEQFGKRQSPHDTYSDEDLIEKAREGAAAEFQLDRRQMWDAQRKAALYAWQASEGKPEEPRS